MPRNGSGTYVPPTNSWSPAVNAVPATPSDYNALLNDMVAAFTQSISKDGQTAYAGNQPMGGFKFTGLAAGIANGESLRFEDVFVSLTEQAPIIRLVPQTLQSSPYTLVLSDGGKHIYRPTSDITPRTWTIPTHLATNFPIGTEITLINDGFDNVTITIDGTGGGALIRLGDGASGNRTLGSKGLATIRKVTVSRWLITGVNIT